MKNKKFNFDILDINLKIVIAYALTLIVLLLMYLAFFK